MIPKKISAGTVHTLPADLKNTITSSHKAHEAWEDVTVLARNEWICWVTSAKKPETRIHRIKRTCEQLLSRKRRPCCWAGCIHR